MKVNLKKEEDSFKPITLEIQIETKEEAEGFYNIFNHTDININPNGIGRENADEIRKLLKLFHNPKHFNNFARYIKNESNL